MQKHCAERTVQSKPLVFEMLQCMVDDVHLANNTVVTVAILAQGTSRAVASTQAFLFGRFASCGARQTGGAQQDHSDSFANPKKRCFPRLENSSFRDGENTCFSYALATPRNENVTK